MPGTPQVVELVLQVFRSKLGRVGVRELEDEYALVDVGGLLGYPHEVRGVLLDGESCREVRRTSQVGRHGLPDFSVLVFDGTAYEAVFLCLVICGC